MINLQDQPLRCQDHYSARKALQEILMPQFALTKGILEPHGFRFFREEDRDALARGREMDVQPGLGDWRTILHLKWLARVSGFDYCLVECGGNELWSALPEHFAGQLVLACPNHGCGLGIRILDPSLFITNDQCPCRH